jgi:hypothetical protein
MYMLKKPQLSQARWRVDGHGDIQEMTLPDERYRALKWAESFMQDLLDPAKTPRVPRSVRQQARSVLRHYPGSYYLDELARRAPEIITPEMEAVHRFIRSGESDPEVSQPHDGSGRSLDL